MKVYTVQHISVWKQLQKTGEYSTDTKFICDEDFDEPYAWLCQQAKKRIKGWQTNRPLWLWTERPDLRAYRFFKNPDEPKIVDHVLLELEIPMEQLLISEFGLWHHVLNGFAIARNEKEAKILDKATDKYIRQSFKEMPKKIRDLITKTWDKCICDENGELNGFDDEYIEPRSFQAIVEKISLDQVKKVKPFKMINKK